MVQMMVSWLLWAAIIITTTTSSWSSLLLRRLFRLTGLKISWRRVARTAGGKEMSWKTSRLSMSTWRTIFPLSAGRSMMSSSRRADACASSRNTRVLRRWTDLFGTNQIGSQRQRWGWPQWSASLSFYLLIRLIKK